MNLSLDYVQLKDLKHLIISQNLILRTNMQDSNEIETKRIFIHHQDSIPHHRNTEQTVSIQLNQI
jgi:hypothetical protein